jgi:hypothetical protein
MGCMYRRGHIEMTANEVLQEALTVIEKYVPANTPDGQVIEKMEKAIARFKLNSRNQNGDTNGQN